MTKREFSDSPDAADLAARADGGARGSRPHSGGTSGGLTAVETSDAIRDGARLSALRDLELLDIAPDETIDRFTRLATEFLGAPVSVVSLVDADRQFFISQQGLSGEWEASRQTPLSHSFCQHAVATREPLIVTDARVDPRVRENLAVRDLGVIAYAGMPLILEDGNAVGALCAIDSEPRQWTEHDLSVLADLTAAVKSLLDLRVELTRRGLHDRLTGLPNEALLASYGNQFLRQHEGDEMVAVLCAGLDHFNQINQVFGPDNADLVLQAVAKRLEGSVRSTDVFGRLRGDVFTLIAPGVSDEAEALGLAGRLRRVLSEDPLEIEGEKLWVSVTVGIATGRAGARGSDLISEASNAMREAKQRHSRDQIAEEGWTEQAAAQLQLRQALGGALGRGEIGVVFQPIVELEDGQLKGFEALARWTHHDLGPVSPGDFIPIAELTSDIIPIGEWMLEQSVSQLASWRAQGHPELHVTVNVSPLQLEQPNFAEVVAGILGNAGLEGEALGVEITEGGLLEPGPIQLSNLHRLKNLGAQIILDDFGTGYSALGYLRRFPIDVIKIDRTFVEEMAADRHAAALVQAILAMARGMDMEVVAEGIETAEQQQILRLLGCPLGQGYLFSPPRTGDLLSLN